MAFPVLFVHGMWSSGAVWEGFATRFETRGHVVRAPSLPHHGGPGAAPSALGRLGLADYLAFLRREADALPAPPLLVGHGLGGLLVMRLAAEGVGFASTHLGTMAQGNRRWLLRVLRDVVSAPGWWRRPVRLSAATARRALFGQLPPDAQARALENLGYESGRVVREVAFASPGRSTPWPASGLPRPSLVVHGTEDRFASIAAAQAATRRAGPRATFTQLAGRGHWLPAEPGWEQLADDVAHWAASFAP